MMMKWRMLIVALTLISTWLVGDLGAQGAFLKADFVRTRLIRATDPAPVVIEEGSYFIAPDGRYRIDRVSDGLHTAEIINYRENQRITLDYELKQAVVGSLRFVWSPPAARPRWVPGGPPSPMRKDSEDIVKLGTKIVEGLTLEGLLHTTVSSGAGVQILHRFELWTYRFPNPKILPILLEQRIEGPNEIDERHITAVTTIPAPPGIFEIPRGFKLGEALR